MFIEVTKKRFFGILGFVLLVASIFGVIAYNSSPGNPAVFGHSVDEIEGLRALLLNFSENGGGTNLNNGISAQTYSTPGTYTFSVPPGVTRLKVRLAGGVSGGTTVGGTTSYPVATGGGYVEGLISVSASTYTVIVGAGGDLAARTDVGAQQALANGNPSSFGALLAQGGSWTGTIGGASGGYLNYPGGSSFLVPLTRGANGMVIIEYISA